MDLVFISNASAVSIQIQIQEGFILSLSVAIHDGTFYHSDTFTLSFSWAQQLMETYLDDVDSSLKSGFTNKIVSVLCIGFHLG